MTLICDGCNDLGRELVGGQCIDCLHCDLVDARAIIAELEKQGDAMEQVLLSNPCHWMGQVIEAWRKLREVRS